MARLKFREEGGTAAVGMWAKDGEYVEFDQAIDCVGPVGARMMSTESLMLTVGLPGHCWSLELRIYVSREACRI